MNNSGPLAFLGTLILPERILRDGVVLCDDGRITAVGPRDAVRLPDSATRIEVPGGFIAPGYVDIHVHGGGGADFMDGTREAVLTATRAHARHGTTSIFPTTTTGTRSQIDAMLRAARAARDEWRIGDGARVAGVHFYGPYFAEDKIATRNMAAGIRMQRNTSRTSTWESCAWLPAPRNCPARRTFTVRRRAAVTW